MMKEKTTLINGGQKLFELNQFRFAAGRKLVQKLHEQSYCSYHITNVEGR